MDKLVTLFPHPDSPTTPTILFFGMSNETLFTDITVPLSVKKHVSRLSGSIRLSSLCI